jgi:hypothetical protein
MERIRVIMPALSSSCHPLFVSLFSDGILSDCPSHHISVNSLILKCQASQQCQNMGHSVLWCSVTGLCHLMGDSNHISGSLTDSSASDFAASSFRVWLKASLRHLSPSTSHHCFMSRSFKISTNSQAG